MLLHLMGSAADGGAETYFLSLVDALRRDGVQQAAALRPHAGREQALAGMGIPTQVLPFGRFDLSTKPRAANFASQVGATVVLAWMSRAASKVPPGPWLRAGRLGGYYDLRFFRRCELLVANTLDIRDYILRRGWASERVAYITNFAAADEHAALPRSTCGTPRDAPLLLSMGRLHREKGHDVTLRALTQLPGVWLWLAGVGPEEHALKQLAHRLGVAERVRFLGWRDDAGALYRAADLCVFPSREEPLGNVVLQSWVYGLPIVATRSIGPASLIRDGEDGLLVPVDAADDLAAGVHQLLNNPTLRTRLQEAGLRRVAAEYNQGAVVRQWRSVLGL